LISTLAGAFDVGLLEGAMPQFDLSTFPSQIFWLVILFGLLYLALSRVALPRIGDVIEARANRIKKDLADAERLKSETEAALKAYEQALADAKSRAGAIAKETRDRLTAETDRERAGVDKQIAAKVTEAEKRIADSKAKAVASVSEIAASTASAIISKLTGKEASQDAVRKAASSS
jgi:F-type H+-transporting ATPase subunit b